jgi:hypothetical protein
MGQCLNGALAIRVLLRRRLRITTVASPPAVFCLSPLMAGKYAAGDVATNADAHTLSPTKALLSGWNAHVVISKRMRCSFMMMSGRRGSRGRSNGRRSRALRRMHINEQYNTPASAWRNAKRCCARKTSTVPPWTKAESLGSKAECEEIRMSGFDEQGLETEIWPQFAQTPTTERVGSSF